MKKTLTILVLALMMLLLPTAAFAADLDLESASGNLSTSTYTWDSTGKILTLNNASIDGDIILPDGDVTIKLSGTNTANDIRTNASTSSQYVTITSVDAANKGKLTLQPTSSTNGDIGRAGTYTSNIVFQDVIFVGGLHSGDVGHPQTVKAVDSKLTVDNMGWMTDGGIILEGSTLTMGLNQCWTEALKMDDDSVVHLEGSISNYGHTSAADMQTAIGRYLPYGYEINNLGYEPTSIYPVGSDIPASNITLQKPYVLTIVNGGTGATVGGEIAVGTPVTLNAGTNGSEPFTGWTSSDVTVSNASSADAATFIMPAKAVTVTANWQSTSGTGTPGTIAPPSLVLFPDDYFTRYYGCPQNHTCPIHPFKDAYPKAAYHDVLHYCIDEGFIVGFPENYLCLDKNITRAQIVSILWRIEGSPVNGQGKSGVFVDVPENEWYTEAVEWATAREIVFGYDMVHFGPNDAISREELAAILWRYAQYKDIDVSVGEDTNILSYEDAFDIAEYSIPAVQWACGSGIFSGTFDEMKEGVLAPQQLVNRLEAAEIIFYFCEKIMK